MEKKQLEIIQVGQVVIDKRFLSDGNSDYIKFSLVNEDGTFEEVCKLSVATAEHFAREIYALLNEMSKLP